MVYTILEAVKVNPAQSFFAHIKHLGRTSWNRHRINTRLIPDMTNVKDHADMSVIYFVEKGYAFLNSILLSLEVLNRNGYIGTFYVTS